MSERRPCLSCASGVSAGSPRATSSRVRAWLDPEDAVIPAPCPQVQEQQGEEVAFCLNIGTVCRYHTEGLCGCEPLPLILGMGFVTRWASVLGTLLPGGRAGLMGTWRLAVVFS